MFSSMKQTLRVTILSVIAIFFTTSSANAEILFLAGYSANDHEDSYGYGGAIIPIMGSSLDSDGFRVKLWGSYTNFEYEGFLPGGTGGIATTFEGEGPGAEAAVGYQWSLSSSIKATTYLGAAWKDVDIDPGDPGSDVEAEEFGFKVQQELNFGITENIDAAFIGSYTFGFNDEYFGRFRPGYTFQNGWKIGPEVVLIGGEVFDKQRYGAFIDGSVGERMGLGFSLGAEDEASTSDNAFYGTVSVSYRY